MTVPQNEFVWEDEFQIFYKFWDRPTERICLRRRILKYHIFVTVPQNEIVWEDEFRTDGWISIFLKILVADVLYSSDETNINFLWPSNRTNSSEKTNFKFSINFGIVPQNEFVWEDEFWNITFLWPSHRTKLSEKTNFEQTDEFRFFWKFLWPSHRTNSSKKTDFYQFCNRPTGRNRLRRRMSNLLTNINSFL